MKLNLLQIYSFLTWVRCLYTNSSIIDKNLCNNLITYTDDNPGLYLLEQPIHHRPPFFDEAKIAQYWRKVIDVYTQANKLMKNISLPNTAFNVLRNKFLGIFRARTTTKRRRGRGKISTSLATKQVSRTSRRRKKKGILSLLPEMPPMPDIVKKKMEEYLKEFLRRILLKLKTKELTLPTLPIPDLDDIRMYFRKKRRPTQDRIIRARRTFPEPFDHVGMATKQIRRMFIRGIF